MRKMAMVFGVVFGVLFGMVSLPAAAAVDASVTTALAGIQTTATDYSTAVLPILIGVLALVIGFKLLKRFVNKI